MVAEYSHYPGKQPRKFIFACFVRSPFEPDQRYPRTDETGCLSFVTMVRHRGRLAWDHRVDQTHVTGSLSWVRSTS